MTAMPLSQRRGGHGFNSHVDTSDFPTAEGDQQQIELNFKQCVVRFSILCSFSEPGHTPQYPIIIPDELLIWGLSSELR